MIEIQARLDKVPKDWSYASHIDNSQQEVFHYVKINNNLIPITFWQNGKSTRENAQTCEDIAKFIAHAYGDIKLLLFRGQETESLRECVKSLES